MEEIIYNFIHSCCKPVVPSMPFFSIFTFFRMKKIISKITQLTQFLILLLRMTQMERNICPQTPFLCVNCMDDMTVVITLLLITILLLLRGKNLAPQHEYRLCN